MKATEAVSDRIRGLCYQNDITVYQLSFLSGMSQSTIKSIINGKSQNPGIVTIKKICDGLDIGMTEFFMDELFINLEWEIE